MREYKFRGKRIDTGEWTYGSFVFCSKKHAYIVGYFDRGRYDESQDMWINGGCVAHKVKIETVGQCTGLHDKNGKEICEGDIVKHHDDILSVAIYNSAHCAYVMTDITGNRNRCQCDKLGNYSSLWIEAIGNIHDNPELISSQQR